MHETLITAYDCPVFFQDTMGRGRFRSFHHDHHFQEVGGQTLLWDVVSFSLPLGAPGRWVGKAVVVPHVLDLMARRFELIKRLAEGEGWRRYLSEPVRSPAQAATSAAPAAGILAK